MILTIAIPTVVNRKEQFDLLRLHIKNQINELGFQKEVELISECDDKQISIGAKRQLLIEKAQGDYLVMIDDDDWIPYNFVLKVVEALKTNPDCVGYLEKCIYHNRIERSCISNRFANWGSNIFGFNHVRTPFFKVPIKTELVKKIGCVDMRFGEDHDFAKRIKPLIKTEVFINEFLYEYRYKQESHNVKYGIK
jgi:glycosyltransferase involved in cell wall biosynthesis